MVPCTNALLPDENYRPSRRSAFPPRARNSQETPRMDPGDRVADVRRPGTDEASGPGAVGQGSGTMARSPRTEKPLEDIQDIIDKLAAVNQELRRPKSSAASRSN